MLILGETSQGEAREFQDGVAQLVGFLDQDNDYELDDVCQFAHLGSSAPPSLTASHWTPI